MAHSGFMSPNSTRKRSTPTRRLTLSAVTIALCVLPLATPAGAIVEGPCDGNVTIAGKKYTPKNDTAANPIVVPDEPGLIAKWEGSTDVPIINHKGQAGVVIGPSTWVLATWQGANGEKSKDADGDYAIDDARNSVAIDLVGLYEITAMHSGDGGTCEGSVMVFFEGNPVTNPVGAGAGLGTLVAAVGVGVAGRKRIS